ncbi:CPBP family glutamic-type intramembrane protease [Lusitaniella coriacea]|uniref:CPBP family glutamic-type intramembrane protease n=1 Tax=Lusitaniella coriacea TaxID=1983105 RepID=UPI003CF848E2
MTSAKAFDLKLFSILWVGGMLGILSLLGVNLPLPEGTDPAISKWLILLQPTILLSVSILIGTVLAPKVSLAAPLASAIVRRKPIAPILQSQGIAGLLGGTIGGLATYGIVALWKPFLPETFVTKGEELSNTMPVLTRLLYGGITEELLLRWGFMTLLVWVGWRIFQRRKGKPRKRYFAIAILLSSLLFGLGHLPVAFALSPEVTTSLIAYVIGLNSLFGAIAGYLYWKFGLEAAIFAHMTAHGVLIVLQFLF